MEQLRGSTVERAKKALTEARAQVGSGGSLRSDRMLRAPEVVKRTGMSRTTIWRLEREGKFPKRVQVSKNIVAWREREVAAWQDQKGRS